jgi:hypothetical protein
LHKGFLVVRPFYAPKLLREGPLSPRTALGEAGSQKRLSTFDMSENLMRGPFSQSSPKALFKALREKEDQLVSFRFFDGHYLEFSFLNGY